MALFRKFRVFPRSSTPAEKAEVARLLRKGPHDKPADIRHNHVLPRSVGGW